MPADYRTLGSRNTHDQLVKAAQRCVERDGIAKLNIKRVAEEASVTRQTVYRYFPTIDDLLTAASFAVGGEVLTAMQARLARCKSFPERIIESIVFLVGAIPDDPFLGQYFSPRSRPQTHIRQVFSDAPLEYSYRAVRSMYGKDRLSPAEERWLRGLAEHALRLVLALILAPSRRTATKPRMREYLEIWIRPLLTRP